MIAVLSLLKTESAILTHCCSSVDSSAPTFASSRTPPATQAEGRQRRCLKETDALGRRRPRGRCTVRMREVRNLRGATFVLVVQSTEVRNRHEVVIVR